jgi:hypothetical protein
VPRAGSWAATPQRKDFEMIEAVCFEKDHRYVKLEGRGGYVCRNCRAYLSDAEFEKRANTSLQQDALIPLRFCGICDTWHCPQEFDVNAVKEKRL